MTAHPSCPRCGADALVPVVYGEPDAGLREQERRGEVAIGGCVIMEDSPDLRCRDCGAGFLTQDPPPAPT